jgi:ADP-ribosylglycohydrolase
MVGVIIGTAVGDAIGLPTEGMSRRRVRRLARGPLRHRLLFGRGMASDDTEHTCMVAQALLASGGEPGRFARSLGWRLRWWLLGLPAGVGKATARAILKLWLGFPPARSGVRSAGNGPAMRAAVLGVYCRPAEGPRLAALVRESTRVTHTDPRAELGALAVAVAARYAADRQAGAIDPQEYLATLRAYTQDAELLHRVGIAATLAGRGAPLDELCAELGLSRGLSGFIYDTVPVALFCFDHGERHPVFVRAGRIEVFELDHDVSTIT